MICEACGANAEEIRPNHYRCKYCTHEFSVMATRARDTYSMNRNSLDDFEEDLEQDAMYSGIGKSPLAKRVREAFEKDLLEANGMDVAQKRILSGSEIYDRAIDGVVEIYATTKGMKGAACSSGFVISELGFVLTNAHAVLDPFGQVYKVIQVKTQKGVYPAFPIAIGKPADGENNSVDLCLLYVEGLHENPNRFGDVTELKNGQKVYLIGNSLGAGICITSGIISDKERAMPGLSYPYIMTDAAANPGNSGGPLYNEYGEVIGVLVAGVDGAKGMNYAIPANVVEAFMTYVINGSKIKKANLGELNKYAKSCSTYSISLSMAFTGVKLLLDVIEFVVNLFKKK